MNFWGCKSFNFILLVTLLLSPVAVRGAKTPSLQYRFSDGVTNLYSVAIEVSGGGSAGELIAGNLTVTARQVSSNVFALRFTGSLTPRPLKRETDATSRMIYTHPARNIYLNEGSEIQFDGAGRILRVINDNGLPIPLGTIGQMFVESLPLKTQSRWETTAEMSVLEEPLNLGPATTFSPSSSSSYAYYGNSTRGAGALPVSCTMRYEVKTRTSTLVTLAKRISLESRMRSGNEARVMASGQGEVVLEAQSGLLQRSDMECTMVTVLDAVTRRTSVALHLKRLEGAERDQAVRPPPPSLFSTPSEAPKKLSADEVRALLVDLDSSDDNARSRAVTKLSTAKFAEMPPEFLARMVKVVENRESATRYLALRVLAEWGTAAEVPLLVKLLGDADNYNRGTLVQALGRLKAKEAIEPLVAMMASGSSDAYAAAEALIKIGPAAEDSVLPLLKEKHLDTQRNACRVLKDIGTAKSIDPLREQMLSSDRTVSAAATDAVRAIREREKG